MLNQKLPKRHCRSGSFYKYQLDGGLVGSFDDLDELFGDEGCAADEAAVDVGLGKKLICVAVVHGAAVEDGDGAGILGAVELANDGADVLADFLSLLGGGGHAGADGPDGFVGNDQLANLFFGNAAQTGLDLHGDPFAGDAQLTLLEGLAAAHDGDETLLHSSLDLGVDVLVGLAHGTALAVADDDIFAAGIGEHVGGNLAGVSAGGVGVAVLSANANAGLAHSADGGGDADGGDTKSNIAPAALRQNGLELGHESLGFRRSLVHFPVAGNNGLTILSVHNLLSPDS